MRPLRDKGLLLGLLLLAMTGCTAAAMRIDVEVYKGPLSREPEVQWGEFIGMVNELADSMTSYNDATLALAVHEGYLEPTDLVIQTPSLRRLQEKNPILSWTRTIVEDIKPYPDYSEQIMNWCQDAWLKFWLIHSFTPDVYIGCLIMAQLHDDAAQVVSLVDSLRSEIQHSPAEGVQRLGREARLFLESQKRWKSAIDKPSEILEQCKKPENPETTMPFGEEIVAVLSKKDAKSCKDLGPGELESAINQLKKKQKEPQRLRQVRGRRMVRMKLQHMEQDVVWLVERVIRIREGTEAIQSNLSTLSDQGLRAKATASARDLAKENDALAMLLDGLRPKLGDVLKEVQAREDVLEGPLDDSLAELIKAADRAHDQLVVVRKKAETLQQTLAPGRTLTVFLYRLDALVKEAQGLLAMTNQPPPGATAAESATLDAVRKHLALASRMFGPEVFPSDLDALKKPLGLDVVHDALKNAVDLLDKDLPAITKLKQEIKPVSRMIAEKFQESEVIAGPWREASNLVRQASHDHTRQEKERILQRASEVGMQLKVKAFYWAGAHITASPRKRTVRVSMANFTNLASEYSNQLSARADALLKQMNGQEHIGHDRKELPLSVHLRDAATTDFTNVYIWNRAVGLPLPEDMFYHPGRAFSSNETADRVRAFERLFANYNWSHINTVYASGQGDVRMALIKDDIGNWNLKSFDNDPTKLLEAYTDLTKAAVDTAITAVKVGTAGPAGVALQPGINAAVNRASRFVSGQFGSGRPAETQEILTLHERAVQQLQELGKTTDGKDRKDVIQAMRQIFADYGKALEKLQRSAVLPDPKTSE